MITCKINGKAVDIFEDMKINMKLSNPMFSEKFINEGYSYSFEFPNTSKNKAINIGYKSKVEIYFKGVLFINAYIISYIKTDASLNVNIVTDAKFFIDECETLLLTELDYAKIKICEETDLALEKRDAWENHMNNTLVTDIKTLTHFFPTIETWGYNNYDGDTEYDENLINEMFQNGERVLNRNTNGEYLLNFDIDHTTIPKQWITSVAPCPKADYVLKTIFNHFGLRLVVNELDDILEYQQLWIWNNFVLDKYITETRTILGLTITKKYNVHGTEIDLKKHVPNTSLFDFLKMLNEIFDIYIVIDNKNISVFRSKNQINRAPVNVTKFASETFNDDLNEFEAQSYSFNLSEEDAAYFRMVKTSGVEKTYEKPYEVKSYPISGNSNNENELSAFPLKTEIISNYFGCPYSTAVYNSQADKTTATWWKTWPHGELQSRAFSPYYIKSDEYPNGKGEIFDRIYYGLSRGVWSGFTPGFDYTGTAYDPDNNSVHNAIYTLNFRDAFYGDLEHLPEVNINHILGKTSVYLNGEHNYFDVYKTEKLDVLYKSITKTKLLYLPLFEIIELMKWKNTKHVIQQKNESFKGFVKNISFTISNDGLSATEVAYVVQSND